MTVPPGLTRTVDAFWSFAGSGERARVLPDGCMDFLFDLNSATARVIGPMTRAAIVAPPRGERYFGVRFLPGVAALLVGARAWELENSSVELTGLLRAPHRHLPEQVAEAKNDAERARVVECYLNAGNARLRPEDPRLRAAATELARTFGAQRVRELADTVGISERQLERLFLERVGVRPKVFARVMRLQRAVTLLEWRRLGSLRAVRSQAELALEAGYSDEPHLLREFRELAGTTPRELAREQHVGFVQDGSPAPAHAP